MEDEENETCRRRKRRSIRVRRRSAVPLVPFNIGLDGPEDENVPNEEKPETVVNQDDVYGSLWMDTNEPAVRKKRRSSMFIGNYQQSRLLDEEQIEQTEEHTNIGNLGSNSLSSTDIYSMNTYTDKNDGEGCLKSNQLLLSDVPSVTTINEQKSSTPGINFDHTRTTREETVNGDIAYSPTERSAEPHCNYKVNPNSGTTQTDFPSKSATLTRFPDSPKNQQASLTKSPIDTDILTPPSLKEAHFGKTTPSSMSPEYPESPVEHLNATSHEDSYLASAFGKMVGKVVDLVKTSPSYLFGIGTEKGKAEVSASPVLKCPPNNGGASDSVLNVGVNTDAGMTLSNVGNNADAGMTLSNVRVNTDAGMTLSNVGVNADAGMTLSNDSVIPEPALSIDENFNKRDKSIYSSPGHEQKLDTKTCSSSRDKRDVFFDTYNAIIKVFQKSPASSDTFPKSAETCKDLVVVEDNKDEKSSKDIVNTQDLLLPSNETVASSQNGEPVKLVDGNDVVNDTNNSSDSSYTISSPLMNQLNDVPDLNALEVNNKTEKLKLSENKNQEETDSNTKTVHKKYKRRSREYTTLKTSLHPSTDSVLVESEREWTFTDNEKCASVTEMETMANENVKLFKDIQVISRKSGKKGRRSADPCTIKHDLQNVASDLTDNVSCNNQAEFIADSYQPVECSDNTNNTNVSNDKEHTEPSPISKGSESETNKDTTLQDENTYKGLTGQHSIDDGKGEIPENSVTLNIAQEDISQKKTAGKRKRGRKSIDKQSLAKVAQDSSSYTDLIEEKHNPPSLSISGTLAEAANVPESDKGGVGVKPGRKNSRRSMDNEHSSSNAKLIERVSNNNVPMSLLLSGTIEETTNVRESDKDLVNVKCGRKNSRRSMDNEHSSSNITEDLSNNKVPPSSLLCGTFEESANLPESDKDGVKVKRGRKKSRRSMDTKVGPSNSDNEISYNTVPSSSSLSDTLLAIDPANVPQSVENHVNVKRGRKKSRRSIDTKDCLSNSDNTDITEISFNTVPVSSSLCGTLAVTASNVPHNDENSVNVKLGRKKSRKLIDNKECPGNSDVTEDIYNTIPVSSTLCSTLAVTASNVPQRDENSVNDEGIVSNEGSEGDRCSRRRKSRRSMDSETLKAQIELFRVQEYLLGDVLCDVDSNKEGDPNDEGKKDNKTDLKKRSRKSTDVASVKSQDGHKQAETDSKTKTVGASRKRKAETSVSDIEQIYRNKNFVKPEEHKPWLTILESPDRFGETMGKKRLHRFINFEKPTLMKLRRRQQKAKKNGWNENANKRRMLPDDEVKNKLNILWAELDSSEPNSPTLQEQLKQFVETE